MVRAVLFDLDDTLFDHAGCARDALEGVRAGHPCFAALPFVEFEQAHARVLELLHAEVLAGRVGLDDARRERFRRLFAEAGSECSDIVAHEAAEAYRSGYIRARRAILGAEALLARLQARARIGVVTNNLRHEQSEKLRACSLDRFVDVLVVSEEAGMSKPDPRIFEIALERLGCTAAEAVMIGDSWAADIVGAHAAGIRAVWFNPRGDLPPDASVPVLRSLEPADEALQLIFDANRD